MNYNHQHMYELCKQHMHSYVLAEMNDGTQVDGIITGLDNDHAYMAAPIGQDGCMPTSDPYQNYSQGPYRFGGFGYGYSGYGNPGYGYGGYGQGYPGYGYGGYGGHQGYGRPRRFDRLVLPLAALTALSVLPWY